MLSLVCCLRLEVIFWLYLVGVVCFDLFVVCYVVG